MGDSGIAVVLGMMSMMMAVAMAAGGYYVYTENNKKTDEKTTTPTTTPTTETSPTTSLTTFYDGRHVHISLGGKYLGVQFNAQSTQNPASCTAKMVNSKAEASAFKLTSDNNKGFLLHPSQYGELCGYLTDDAGNLIQQSVDDKNKQKWQFNECNATTGCKIYSTSGSKKYLVDGPSLSTTGVAWKFEEAP